MCCLSTGLTGSSARQWPKRWWGPVSQIAVLQRAVPWGFLSLAPLTRCMPSQVLSCHLLSCVPCCVVLCAGVLCCGMLCCAVLWQDPACIHCIMAKCLSPSLHACKVYMAVATCLTSIALMLMPMPHPEAWRVLAQHFCAAAGLLVLGVRVANQTCTSRAQGG